MATSPVGPGDISLRDFIEAVGSAEAPHGAVSTAAVSGSLGTSLLLMVAALPQTRSDSVADRAKLVEAEAEVPLAMAEAFRSGRLGILDYYKLQNVQADTNMRGAIALASGPQRK